MSVQSTNNKIACCSNSAVSTIGTTTLLLGLLIASVGAVAMIGLKMGLPSSNFLAFGNAIGNYGAIAMMSAGSLSLLVSIACAAVLIKRSCAPKPTTQLITEKQSRNPDDATQSKTKITEHLDLSSSEQSKGGSANMPSKPNPEDRQVLQNAEQEEINDTAELLNQLCQVYQEFPNYTSNITSIEQKQEQIASSSNPSSNEWQQCIVNGSSIQKTMDLNIEFENTLNEEQIRKTDEYINLLSKDDQQTYGDILRRMPILSFITYPKTPEGIYTLLWKTKSGEVTVQRYDATTFDEYENYVTILKFSTFIHLTNIQKT